MIITMTTTPANSSTFNLESTENVFFFLDLIFDHPPKQKSVKTMTIFEQAWAKNNDMLLWATKANDCQ